MVTSCACSESDIGPIIRAVSRVNYFLNAHSASTGSVSWGTGFCSENRASMAWKSAVHAGQRRKRFTEFFIVNGASKTIVIGRFENRWHGNCVAGRQNHSPCVSTGYEARKPLL